MNQKNKELQPYLKKSLKEEAYILNQTPEVRVQCKTIQPAG